MPISKTNWEIFCCTLCKNSDAAGFCLNHNSILFEGESYTLTYICKFYCNCVWLRWVPNKGAWLKTRHVKNWTECFSRIHFTKLCQMAEATSQVHFFWTDDDKKRWFLDMNNGVKSFAKEHSYFYASLVQGLFPFLFYQNHNFLLRWPIVTILVILDFRLISLTTKSCLTGTSHFTVSDLCSTDKNFKTVAPRPTFLKHTQRWRIQKLGLL